MGKNSMKRPLSYHLELLVIVGERWREEQGAIHLVSSFRRCAKAIVLLLEIVFSIFVVQPLSACVVERKKYTDISIVIAVNIILLPCFGTTIFAIHW